MKRWHQEGSANVNNNYNDNTSSSYLNSSLKRIRISQSPGELRLERDWQELCTPHKDSSGSVRSDSGGRTGWLRSSDVEFVLYQGFRVSQNQHSHSHAAKLKRNVNSDPLRLVLETANGKSVVVQLSRLYPHQPPVVSSIQTAITTQQQPNNTSRNTTRSGIQHIRVTLAPPRTPTCNIDHSNSYSSNNDPTMMIPMDGDSHEHHSPPLDTTTNSINDVTTAVYSNWSPIHRLGDLLDFLLRVLLEPSHQQQQQQQEPSLWMEEENTNGNGMYRRHDPQYMTQQQIQSQQHLHCQQQPFKNARVDAFPRSRFHVGYPYAQSASSSSSSVSCSNMNPLWTGSQQQSHDLMET